MSYIEYVNARPRLEDLMAALSKANGFTNDELVENRSGRMHRAQSKRLTRTGFLRPLLLSIGLIAASPALRIIWAMSVEQRDLGMFFGRLFHALFSLDFPRLAHVYFHAVDGDRLAWIVCGALIALPLFGLFKLRRLSWKLLRDARDGKALAAEGMLMVDMQDERASGRAGKDGDMITTYYYVINKKKFIVNRQAHDAAVVGLNYRVYYAPRTAMVLSIEPVGG